MSLKPLPDTPTVKQVEQVGVKYYAQFGIRELNPDDFNEFCILVHFHSATDMSFPEWLEQVRGMLIKIYAPEAV
jgi:hypothetical protein